MTIYVLDVSTWRCGGAGESPNALGKGMTRMENDSGFLCCLGQFSKRYTTKAQRMFALSPRDVGMGMKKIYDPAFVEKSKSVKGVFSNTPLARSLIAVNDNDTISVRCKISRIRGLLMNHGHSLRVLNQHLIP